MAHSEQFAAAIRAAEKAWYGTPMLARVHPPKGAQLRDLALQGTPRSVADYLADMAGEALASYALSTGLNVANAKQLMRLLVEMAWYEIEPAPPVGDRNQAALKRLEALAGVLKDWIDTGRGSRAERPLALTADLVSRPEQRLALLAPVASALGVCIVMLKAVASNYPLGDTREMAA